MHTMGCPSASALAAAGEQLLIDAEPCAQCAAAGAVRPQPAPRRPGRRDRLSEILAAVNADHADPGPARAALEAMPEHAEPTPEPAPEVEPEPQPEAEEPAAPFEWQIRRDKEQAEKAAFNQAAAAALARGLSYVTGEPWTATPNDPDHRSPGANVTRTRDGLTVNAGLNTWRGNRWSISIESAAAPDGARVALRGWVRDGEASSITCSMTKDPGQLARDIARRLLPGAPAIIARAVEAYNLDNERAAWMEQQTAAFLAAYPGLYHNQHGRNSDTTRTLHNRGGACVSIELSSYSRDVKLTAHDLTPEQALALLATLPKPKPEQEPQP